MDDRIEIMGLACRAVIGVHAEEREAPQDLRIDLVLSADLSAAGNSDKLADAPDYEALSKRVVESVEKSSFKLLERLAEMIAGICLEEEKISAVRVFVEKPWAVGRADGVRVVISRGREG